jgi:hypothetical protein
MAFVGLVLEGSLAWIKGYSKDNKMKKELVTYFMKLAFAKSAAGDWKSPFV